MRQIIRSRPSRSRLIAATVFGSCLWLVCPPAGVAAEKLALNHLALDLPGPPAAVVPADMNGDGLVDLVIPLVYTEYEAIASERVEGLVQVTEVVPALFDRREVRVYLAGADGTYRPAADPLPLPPTVHAIEVGPDGLPVVALTSEGLSALHLISSGPGGTASLVLDPILADPSAMAGSGSFLPGLELVVDLDANRLKDILLPAAEGPATYLTGATGIAASPAARLTLPGDQRGVGRDSWRVYPLPQVQDVDGDHLPDLVVITELSGGARISILRNAGGGRFAPPTDAHFECLEQGETSSGNPELAFFGDLDGDGRAEAVTVSEVGGKDDGLKEAKKPHQLLRFHRLRENLILEPKPYQQLEVIGYPFGGQWPDIGKADFKDLDGDGRRDLVTVTLDFSVFQVVRILATKRVSIGLDFHIWAQGESGRFTEVTGQDLSEKLMMDFNNLKLERFAQFGGDFDGDGASDFVHLGRGKTVTIHRGRPGCRFNDKPDLAIELQEEPQDIGLVKVKDLDGDGRSDLAITRPLEPEDPGASPKVRLDLYLSRGAG